MTLLNSAMAHDALGIASVLDFRTRQTVVEQGKGPLFVRGVQHLHPLQVRTIQERVKAVVNMPPGPSMTIEDTCGYARTNDIDDVTLTRIRENLLTKMPSHSLLRSCLAETAGTFLMVFLGIGVVAAAVLTGAQVALWQVAAVWGIGVTLAIYATAAASGAHLNPAITLAFALLRTSEFPWRLVLPYWAAQVMGAMAAGLAVFVLFHPFILQFEAAHTLVRGTPGSEQAAMVFGEYFPNPAMYGPRTETDFLLSPWLAAAVEATGTAVLAFVVFALVDRRNHSLRDKHLAPMFIGATVAVLISLFAPITQAGWNPARDFGPRVVAYFAGWGSIAIPGPDGGFWVYIVGPILGAPLGGKLYDLLVRPGLRMQPPAGSEGTNENGDTTHPKREP